MKRLRHGHTRRHKSSPTYLSWKAMKRRCFGVNCKHYSYYGGRGITVCARWREFENFLADMGERPKGKTLDRYPDNNGNYEPGNCRWATKLQQQRNTRKRTVFACGHLKVPNNIWRSPSTGHARCRQCSSIHRQKQYEKSHPVRLGRWPKKELL